LLFLFQYIVWAVEPRVRYQKARGAFFVLKQSNIGTFMSISVHNTKRIILALDVNSIEKAVSLMDEVDDEVQVVKVGQELINAQLAGRVAIHAHDRGLDIFWDGKWDDIPETMAKTARATCGVSMVNVHANSTVEGMMAVVEASKSGGFIVLAVTALTSIDTENVELEFGTSRNAKVLYWARMAAYAGCHGIVCSPKELAFLAKYYQREKYPELALEKIIKVVPGTRSPGADKHDQKNVDTQEEAIRNGADWLVIGREITEHKGYANPREAAQALNIRIAQTLAEKQKGVVTV